MSFSRDRERRINCLSIFFFFFSKEFYCVDVAVVLLLMRIGTVKIRL